MAWSLSEFRGTAAELHSLDPGESPGRSVWLMEPTRPALVLGSTQSPQVLVRGVEDQVDIDVVRRRSGGSAVMLIPGRSTWVDLVVNRDDPLVTEDISISFDWVGAAWSDALSKLGHDVEVWHGRLDRTPWSSLICFASIGPGEVHVAGRKVVGISQRRTRHWARYQCLVQHESSEAELLALLDLTDEERQAAASAVRTGTVPGSGRAMALALMDFLPG